MSSIDIDRLTDESRNPTALDPREVGERLGRIRRGIAFCI
jgi:hypothetical protein